MALGWSVSRSKAASGVPVSDARPSRPSGEPASGTPAESNIGPAGEITALAVGYGHLVPIDTSMYHASEYHK
jgi:hypothetical protein